MKLIIFDLDGTLLNTIDDLADSANYALTTNNYIPYSINKYKYFVGNGIKTLVERTLEEQNGMADFDKVLKCFTEHYQVNKANKTAPYNGISETINSLVKQNILVAVASNKTHGAVPPLLKHYFPDVKFASAYGLREGVAPKPNPTVVYNILEDCGVSKEEALYVGDTGVDMKTGKGAGLKTIGVLWGFRKREELEENGADYIISEPKQLLEFVK